MPQVVAGAGAVEHNQLVELSDKAFAGLPTDPTTGMDLVRKVSHRNWCAAACSLAGHQRLRRTEQCLQIAVRQAIGKLAAAWFI